MDVGSRMEMLANHGSALVHICVSDHFSRCHFNRLLSSLPHYLLLSSVLLNKGNVGIHPGFAYRPPYRAGRDKSLSLAP